MLGQTAPIFMPVTPVTRPSLLLRVRDSSDTGAWAEFVDLYTPLIFAYARKRGMQDADAADLAQDVLLSVSNAIGGFEYDRRIGAFRAWLFRIAGNRMKNIIAARKIRPQASGDSKVHRQLQNVSKEEDQQIWEQEYQQRTFEWAADRVRTEFKDATFLAFWKTSVDQLPIESVAKELGLSSGAVYIARSRVTRRLREIFRKSVTDD